jgi:hypothetical protein
MVGIQPNEAYKLQNLIILLVKRNIYITRCGNNQLSLENTKAFIKHYARIEQTVLKDKWLNKWGNLGLKLLQA